jgi:hypothetical protein
LFERLDRGAVRVASGGTTADRLLLWPALSGAAILLQRATAPARASARGCHLRRISVQPAEGALPASQNVP